MGHLLTPIDWPGPPAVTPLSQVMFSAPPRFSTSSVDFEEADYLVRRARQRQARIAVSILLLGSALAVVGCSGNTLVVYKNTKNFNLYSLPSIWPSNFDDRSVKATLGAGVVVAVGSIAVLVSLLTPSPRQRVNLQNTLVSVAGASGAIASIFSVAYGFVLNASQAETMMTWSCKWGDLLNGLRPDFQRICTESRFSLYMMIAVTVLELGMTIMGSLGFLMEKKMAVVRSTTAKRKSISDETVEAVA
ncbi:hypothetical protein FGG08_003613 [Glutinoglossum americanum]|uniref:Uncharacterized protein n=1 Tax=Glutinoglossum americanum TaxID=1670608 RepID=A0A9P8I6V1_9PEZI|nr:hypothetical protein FGG08_003613 [Glutinoglossum americanum]